MLAYYIPFVLLWIAAFNAFVLKKPSHAYFLATITIVFLFVVLRYQTGYDWVSYTSLFSSINGVDQFSFTKALALSVVSSKELLYVYTNLVLKQISNNYVIVQVASGAVLFYGVLKYLARSTRQYAFVFAVLFSWLMFALFFSVVRQAFAVGFFFLFLISQEKGARKTSLLWFFLAVGMQYSSIMYFMLYYVSRSKVIYNRRYWVWGLSLMLLFLSFARVDLATAILKHIPFFGMSMLEEKMHWYLEDRVHTVDLSGLAFVSMYTFVVGFILMKAKKYIHKNEESIIIYNFAILFLPIQTFFLNYSIFRNRVLYVAMVLALIIIADYLSNMKAGIRLIAYSLAMILSFSYYTLYLSSASGLPFVPYQNVVGHYLFEYISDGEDRLDKYTLQHK